MSKIINIVSEKSNVGKTVLIEGLIKELVSRGITVGTIKHDVHGFDIDYKGKDTYRHRKAGADTVVISSNNRIAIIKELEQEVKLQDIINLYMDKEVILIEGYKDSNYKKIEVYRDKISHKLVSDKKDLIIVATDTFDIHTEVPMIYIKDYVSIVDIILQNENSK